MSEKHTSMKNIFKVITKKGSTKCRASQHFHLRIVLFIFDFQHIDWIHERFSYLYLQVRNITATTIIAQQASKKIFCLYLDDKR